jgi:hypothetical protein
MSLTFVVLIDPCSCFLGDAVHRSFSRAFDCFLVSFPSQCRRWSSNSHCLPRAASASEPRPGQFVWLSAALGPAAQRRQLVTVAGLAARAARFVRRLPGHHDSVTTESKSLAAARTVAVTDGIL